MKTSADKTPLQQLLEIHRAGQLTTADYADALMLLQRAQTPDPIKRAFFVAATIAIAPVAFDVGDDSFIVVHARVFDNLCNGAHDAAQLRFEDLWTDAPEYRPRVADARPSSQDSRMRHGPYGTTSIVAVESTFRNGDGVVSRPDRWKSSRRRTDRVAPRDEKSRYFTQLRGTVRNLAGLGHHGTCGRADQSSRPPDD